MKVYTNFGILPQERIYITGVLDNPFAILRRCDCFVFPSFYESQGLAVLEARMVGLPIIVSNYDAVGSVLIDDKQYLLKGTTAEDIYEGMKAYIDGRIPKDNRFDIDKYNEQGLMEWDELLSF